MSTTEPNAPNGAARLSDYLRALPLYLLPHHLLSRLMLALTRVRLGAIKDLHIRWFARQFRVEMDDALDPDLASYPDFNSFFTRALRPGARPLACGAGQIACPVDGTVSQAGPISDGSLLQAKGQHFSLAELLGGAAERAEPFRGGQFATIYLSPRDYHRIHMPFDGTLREMVHIPGRLFSVNPPSTRVVPNLFARNERVAALFDTAIGPLAVVMVGAIFVGSIETVWGGVITPPHRQRIRTWRYGTEGSAAPRLHCGDELGRFNMGSTVILLFGPERVRLDAAIAPEAPVRMGQRLAVMS